MTGYKHKILSKYSYLPIVWTKFLPRSPRPAGYLSVDQRSRPGEGTRKYKDHLGQEDHLLLSCQNI